jgi:hypothetical protein
MAEIFFLIIAMSFLNRAGALFCAMRSSQCRVELTIGFYKETTYHLLQV